MTSAADGGAVPSAAVTASSAASAPSGGRLLGGVAVALVLAAAALWASSRLTWLTAVWDTPLRGRLDATATGADTEPILVPWALLSLAAIAGVLATSGWARRVVGVLVGVAGAWALLRGAVGFVPPPTDALPAPARLPGHAVDVTAGVAGPVVAVVGALLMLLPGALVAWRAPDLPRLGRRYDAPGATPGDAGRRPDADRDMWESLDAGLDPTADPPGDSDPPRASGAQDRREGPG